MVSRRGRAAQVGTYLGPRAFYTKDMAKKHRAMQDTDLPPRCDHEGCRRSWDTVVINGVVHCEEHRKECGGACAEASRRSGGVGDRTPAEDN